MAKEREKSEERKRAEETLQESEERYRALFEQSRDAIYVTSRDGRIVDVNRSMLELFGYTREEFIRMLAQDTLVDPAHRLRYQREIE
ncbi:MAG: PAS domain S-box protein, partial [Anaerolineae bacterium]